LSQNEKKTAIFFNIMIKLLYLKLWKSNICKSRYTNKSATYWKFKTTYQKI